LEISLQRIKFEHFNKIKFDDGDRDGELVDLFAMKKHFLEHNKNIYLHDYSKNGRKISETKS